MISLVVSGSNDNIIVVVSDWGIINTSRYSVSKIALWFGVWCARSLVSLLYMSNMSIWIDASKDTSRFLMLFNVEWKHFPSSRTSPSSAPLTRTHRNQVFGVADIFLFPSSHFAVRRSKPVCQKYKVNSRLSVKSEERGLFSRKAAGNPANGRETHDMASLLA